MVVKGNGIDNMNNNIDNEKNNHVDNTNKIGVKVIPSANSLPYLIGFI